MAVDLAAIVPLPVTFVDNAAAAFDPLAGEAPLARVVRTMRGAAVVAVAAPLVGAVRESLAAHGLSAVGVAVAEDPGSRAQCLAAGLHYLQRPAAPRPDSRHPSTAGAGRPSGPGDRRAAGREPRRDAGAGGDRQRESRDAHGSVTGTLDRSTLRAVQYRGGSPPTNCPSCWPGARQMNSTSSTSRFAPARRSPSSTVTPTRSPSNCQGTPPLSRRSSHAGRPPAEQMSRDGHVVRHRSP